MRIRQHVNPLSPGYEVFRGLRPRLEPGRPVELEVGCADAQFLFERAAVDPDRHYVGVEIREDLVDLVNERARDEGVPVHAVFCQAQLHLPEIFAPASVDRVYVNFPDPWFKRRHHKRRMVDAALAVGLAHVARPGADVFFQSDVWDIALDAMETFERADDAFVNQAGEWTFWRRGNPYGVRSWREANAEATGLPIWRILYRRR
ncbi:MAG: tRNA (guanosine(46)-N7)-methyltransferase TrmB [Kofleriaceae bacterium]|nr:tRNA (guanine-N7)-methyltransferase [Myxococcales bacterium]MCB9559474.1 tRNA (guanosine(46)-N7)-methyltransferase TrmB [Kofleriaceae bacterium]